MEKTILIMRMPTVIMYNAELPASGNISNENSVAPGNAMVKS